jgi:gliding motility-associated-like protein
MLKPAPSNSCAPTWKNRIPVSRSRWLCILLGLCLFPTLNAQFANGDFSQGALGCNTPTHWQSNGNVQIADNFQAGNQWIDITGCGFGNGNWMEQVVPTTPGMFYQIRLDLGTWWGWGIEDAGVDISIDGVPMVRRYFNDSFTKSFTMNLHWETITTCEFMAGSTSTTIRFTGHGLCSKFSAPPACLNPNPGVIAVDNIHFSDSFILNMDSSVCFDTDSAELTFSYTGPKGYTAEWRRNKKVIGAGDRLMVDTPGLYDLKFSNGCQTIFRNIIVRDAYVKTYNYSPCEGDSVKIGNRIYKTSGDVFDTVRVAGCDTIHRYHVNFISKSIHVENVNLCQGDSVRIGSKYYSKPGNYDLVLKNYRQCDSLLTTRLIPVNNSFATFSDSICTGDTLFFAGKMYTAPGVYEQVLANYRGCDSIIALTFHKKEGPGCKCRQLENMPNVFSPNNDNINEYFPAREVPDMKIWVYNRWGILIYDSEKGQGWNGTVNGVKLPAGTYYYLMEFEDCRQMPQKSHGVLTLVR